MCRNCPPANRVHQIYKQWLIMWSLLPWFFLAKNITEIWADRDNLPISTVRLNVGRRIDSCCSWPEHFIIHQRLSELDNLSNTPPVFCGANQPLIKRSIYWMKVHEKLHSLNICNPRNLLRWLLVNFAYIFVTTFSNATLITVKYWTSVCLYYQIVHFIPAKVNRMWIR